MPKPGSQGLADAGGFKSSIKRAVRPSNLPNKVLQDIYKMKNGAVENHIATNSISQSANLTSKIVPSKSHNIFWRRASVELQAESEGDTMKLSKNNINQRSNINSKSSI